MGKTDRSLDELRGERRELAELDVRIAAAEAEPAGLIAAIVVCIAIAAAASLSLLLAEQTARIGAVKIIGSLGLLALGLMLAFSKIQSKATKP